MSFPFSRQQFLKSGIYAVVGILLLVGGFCGGAIYGSKNYFPGIEAVTGLSNKEVDRPNTVDFASFWKTWNIINEKYVATHGTSTGPVTDQDKVYGAIQGMVASLGDPYTVFLPPKQLENFEGDIRGNFEGVGMEVGIRDGIITVVSPLKNSPAEKSGIMSGDKIVKIDDKVIASGMRVDEAVQLIRGKAGTTVKISVLRGNEKEVRVFSIVRDTINVPTIETETKEANGEKVFIIKFYTFTANSPDLFRIALKDFVKTGASRLIIDLRGNPGGYLEAAVDVASWFLPEGKIIVTEDFGTKEKAQVMRSKGYDAFNENLKLVILVDNGSASASEILAGALHEHGKATLVGDTTFGKGSVQELIPVTEDTSIKVTVARWLTPKGLSISENGIKPDYKVARTAEDIKAGKDPQLDKALEIITTNK